MSTISFFSGRRLLLSEVPKDYRRLLTDPKIKTYPTMVVSESHVECLRCGSRHRQQEVTIVNDHERFYFCPACIQLGRVQSNVLFYGSRWYPRREEETRLAWEGQLTGSQAAVSNHVVAQVAKRQSLLIHAVTGAGKTEMIFQGIYHALKKGWRIAIASPRVDVCLELFPRLQEAFPETQISLLHGRQDQPYEYSSLVICTTHQLLRFYRAFEVVIVDEVDAFPFVDNPILQQGVINAGKQSSAQIMLTATPTDALNQQVAQGQLTKVVLPARFHGHALPVPETLWVSHWHKMGLRKKVLAPIKRLLMRQQADKRRTLIFCPTVDWLTQFADVLMVEFPEWRIGSAHAKDRQRLEKVKTMRQAGYDFFLTTTILERGVTFEDIDVIVIGSNHTVFNRASLVQIAGRVGRSQRWPTGNVYFVHDGWTKAMKEAVQEIQQLNRLAEQRGLIHS